MHKNLEIFKFGGKIFFQCNCCGYLFSSKEKGGILSPYDKENEKFIEKCTACEERRFYAE